MVGSSTKPLRVLGMNSGTSVDGIDLALCEFTPTESTMPVDGKLSLKIIAYSEVPHDIKLKRRILDMVDKKSAGLAELTQINFIIGHAFADAIEVFLKNHNLTLDDVDVIASHGQTMWHQVDASSEVKSTLQIGESSIIMKRTGKTVVNDVRVADMAFGGQGAPLTSFLDVVINAENGKTNAFQNFGGISNTTIITMEDGNVDAVAFDQGPSNILIDHAVRHFTSGAQQFDKDGLMAKSGTVCQELLEELMQHPYYKQPIPKTTGRELFSDAYAEKIIKMGLDRGLSQNDIIATITELTVASVVQSYKDFAKKNVDQITVHGGGAFNPVIMEGIQKGLPNTVVRRMTMENGGLPAACKEAVLFALIGHECIYGRPAQVPSCTGASDYTILGKITPGKNYHEVLNIVANSGVYSGCRTSQLNVIN